MAIYCQYERHIAAERMRIDPISIEDSDNSLLNGLKTSVV